MSHTSHSRHSSLGRHSRRLAAAAVGTLLLAGLAACGDDDTTPTAADPSTEPSSSAPASPSGTAGEDAGSTTAVPVYFVGEAPQGSRLFREFHDVADDDAALAAAQLLTAGDADDPDYSTLLDGVEVTAVSDAGDTIDVTLTGPAQRPASMSAEDATVALQSLVYTVQGVEQSRSPVQLDAGGQDTLLGVDVGEPIGQADELDVLNLVNVTTPAQGQSVSGTFTASGLSSSFEANGPWQVLDADGEVVAEGSATAEGWMDRLYPWEVDVDVSDLPAGDYTFVALTDDPSGGEEGFGPSSDTKAITVG